MNEYQVTLKNGFSLIVSADNIPDAVDQFWFEYRLGFVKEVGHDDILKIELLTL